MAVEKIGVIGAGQMGTGIAHVLALAGYDVVLDDINKDALARAIGVIEKNMLRQAHKGAITEDQIKPALARIRTTQTLDDFQDRDMVMEAATEDEAVKKKIFQDLCKRISPAAMVATNTSSISVTRLAAATDRPENFIGLHFMNPVPVMQLVEVIRGIATNDTTFQAALEIVKRLGGADTRQCRLDLLVVDDALVRLALHILFDQADRFGQGILVDVVQHHVIAGQGQHMRDAGAHLACTDNADFFDCHVDRLLRYL